MPGAAGRLTASRDPPFVLLTLLIVSIPLLVLLGLGHRADDPAEGARLNEQLLDS